MSSIDEPTVLQKFINECTPGSSDETYLFLKDGCNGLYTPNTTYDEASSKLIAELNSCNQKPYGFPVEGTGAFFYLVDKSVVEGKKDRDALSQDFLSPWDKGRAAVTKWTRKDENGQYLHVGRSRHHEHRNLLRYITYFTSKNGRLASNVLYQYIVESENGRRRTGVSVVGKQKRKTEQLEETVVGQPKKMRSMKKNTVSPAQEVPTLPASPNSAEISKLSLPLNAETPIIRQEMSCKVHSPVETSSDIVQQVSPGQAISALPALPSSDEISRSSLPLNEEVPIIRQEMPSDSPNPVNTPSDIHAPEPAETDTLRQKPTVVKAEPVDPAELQCNREQPVTARHNQPSSSIQQNEPQFQSQTSQSIESCLSNAQDAFIAIHKGIFDMKAEYLAASSQKEMRKVNEKNMKLFNIERHLKHTINEAVENSKKAVRDIFSGNGSGGYALVTVKPELIER